MIVVDTSVWAAFFNGAHTPEAAELDRLLAGGASIAILPIILTEVLQGFGSDKQFREVQHMLVRLPILFPTLTTHVLAARLYRALRRKGVTVRGTIDCLIAQTCLDNGLPLFTADRDFAFIARHTKLRLHQPPETEPVSPR